MAVTNDAQLARRLAEFRDALPRRGPLVHGLLRAEILVHRHAVRPRLYWPLFALARRLDPSYRPRPVDVEIDDEIQSLALQPSGYQGRLGLRSLRLVEAVIQHRRMCCAEYTRSLAGRAGLSIPDAESDTPLYYFPVLVENKEEMLRKARNRWIELIAWPIRTPIFPVEVESQLYAYGYEPSSCPVSESVAKKLIGLPTHVQVGPSHRRRLVDLLLGANG